MNELFTNFSHIKDGDACIYFLIEDNSRLRETVLPRVKIGMTNRLDSTLKQFRLQILRANSAEDFKVFHAIKAPSREIARALERRLHQRFAKRRTSHSVEWFDLTAEEVEWCSLMSYDQLMGTNF